MNLTDKFFWFSQPSSVLSDADKMFAYLFGAILILGLVFLGLVRFNSNPINKTLFRKLWNLCLFVGLSGVLWFGVRYENTPIFAQRYWAGLTILIGLVWLGFILKFLAFEYRGKKTEFDREMIKSKYLPKAK